MRKWNLIIDIARCEDCNNCFLSCKDEFVDNDFLPYSVSQSKHGHRWMNIMRKERGQCPVIDVAYRPTPCMHCDEPSCMKEAKVGGVYKRDDGITMIDPEEAKGQQELVDACPYGAIWWNEEKNVSQKCTFCAHLLDGGWKEPRCVQACPTGALKVMRANENEIHGIIDSEGLEVLSPEFQTSPRVYYKNLYRFDRCFIAGSVAIELDGREECAEGARVALLKDSKTIDEQMTDNYGDFKFDKLEEDSGSYRLEITWAAYEKKTLELDLKRSIYAGTLLLRSSDKVPCP